MSASDQQLELEEMRAPAADLPAMALSVPEKALARAQQIIRDSVDDTALSFAYQATGIILRDRGDTGGALAALRASTMAADRLASPERTADVRATYGAALAMAGRTKDGLTELDAALEASTGELVAKTRLRRAHVLHVLGRHEEALTDLKRALGGARRSGDVLWQARILNNRCMVYLAVGELSRADADAEAAGRLFDQMGQQLESVDAGYNRGIVAARQGNLPTALLIFDNAEQRYLSLGMHEPDLILDRGHALLAAGLAAEAADSAQAALAQRHWQPVKRSQLLLFAAQAALAADRPEHALDHARSASRSFASQQRPGWQSRAKFLACQARYRAGDRSPRLLTALQTLAPQLALVRAEESALAYLLAGQLAREVGREKAAKEMLAVSAAYRRSPSPLTRATGWLAAALLAQSAANQRSLLNACSRGLDALDEHRLAFGAAELRAVGTTHGKDLATLAVDAVTAAGSTRAMLVWSERWRAASIADPGVQTSSDPELERELAALREAVRQAEDPDAGPRDRQRNHQRRVDTEAAIHRRRLRQSGSANRTGGLDVGGLLGALGDTRLISLIESGGCLFAITLHRGRVQRREVGPVAPALREAEFARFLLRRIAANPSATGSRVRQAALHALERALLGPLARELDGGPLVLVPPSRLQTAPWALLPCLMNAPFSVAPSARTWLRAHSAQRDAVGDSVALVLGPGLDSGGAEIDALRTVHVDASVLGIAAGSASAGVDAVLAALSGADLAHIAAHGSFRADSAMFSSLLLDEGPLFVHDLDRLTTPPGRIVLSACDSGASASVGADELLGLVSALLRIGSSGVLASIVPVNDEAAVGYMSDVHTALAQGQSLAEAALAGRRAAKDDLSVATAASFTAWGC